MTEFNLLRLDDCQKDEKSSYADKMLDELLKSPYEKVMDLINKNDKCSSASPATESEKQTEQSLMPGKVGPVGPVGRIEDLLK